MDQSPLEARAEEALEEVPAGSMDPEDLDSVAFLEEDLGVEGRLGEDLDALAYEEQEVSASPEEALAHNHQVLAFQADEANLA